MPDDILNTTPKHKPVGLSLDDILYLTGLLGTRSLRPQESRYLPPDAELHEYIAFKHVDDVAAPYIEAAKKSSYPTSTQTNYDKTLEFLVEKAQTTMRSEFVYVTDSNAKDREIIPKKIGNILDDIHLRGVIFDPKAPNVLHDFDTDTLNHTSDKKTQNGLKKLPYHQWGLRYDDILKQRIVDVAESFKWEKEQRVARSFAKNHNEVLGNQNSRNPVVNWLKRTYHSLVQNNPYNM